MKYPILILALFFCTLTFAQKQDKDKEAILKVLNEQKEAWNRNDLEGFMAGYWHSEELKFFGASGVTSGWDKTLANYKKRYPGPEHTGNLEFKIHEVFKINDDAYYVMGEFFLTRTVGNANGVFMIIFKKIDGKWKIIADTSC